MHMKTVRRQTGDWGERAVEEQLVAQGFNILERNFLTRLGEIDLIARKKNIIAFVEVKTRKHEYFPVSQVITYAKQQRLIKAAKQYMQTYDVAECALRFDVAVVLVENDQPIISYIENAFCEKI